MGCPEDEFCFTSVATDSRSAVAGGMFIPLVGEFQDGHDYVPAALEKGATGLCVPSKTYSYMMEGIPLLAIMDECDIVRDIETGAGAWVRNGESEKLADCIRTLREDPERLRAMGRRCRAIYLEKYTTELCTEKYVSLFRSLL